MGRIIKASWFKNLISEFLRIFWLCEKFILRGIKADIKSKPIFIISPPRSGSTILYQIITSYFSVNYITNFIALFYHSILCGFIFHNALFKDKSHNNYYSFKGKTKGLNSPHEGGKFWRQWFPKKRDFVDYSYYNSDKFESLLKTITYLNKYKNRPLVLKNTINSLRLQVIKRVFPNSLIIYIKRDAVQTSYSILRHRIIVNNDKNKWWAAKPENYEQYKKLHYPEQIVKQVYSITKRIEKDLSFWSPSQILTINYEELCNDLNAHLSLISNFIKNNGLNIRVRKDCNLPSLYVSRKENQSDEDFYLLKAEINKLQW